MSSEVYVSPCCVNCGRVVGELDEKEKEAFLSNGFAGLLCFVCEPAEASYQPEIFKGLENGDILGIGDILLQVDASQAQLVVASHARAHERTRARGLSSYTYLNRNLHNQAVLRELVEWVRCPECHGESGYEGFFAKNGCAVCGSQGGIPVLARWVQRIIFGVLENA